ncbi:MAG: hypothetical protein J6L98_05795, partial [Bacteroidales bacterium]|nr:hypothetical protein [Bacteroidales bacterium]
IKMGMKTRQYEVTIDSLSNVIGGNLRAIDSLKTIQDNEIHMRDSLDDMVDRRLGDVASEATIVIDTTLDENVARMEVNRRLALEGWVDSITEPFPEGVSAHVRLRFIRSKAQRLERLEQIISNKFRK